MIFPFFFILMTTANMKEDWNWRGLLCLLSSLRRRVVRGPLAHATSPGAESRGAVEPSSATSTQSERLTLVLRVTEPLGKQSDWSC